MSENLIFFPEDIRIKIIDALRKCQNSSGYWCYPPHRKDSEFVSVWTTAQAVWALQLVGIRPIYFEQAYDILKKTDTCIENGNIVGWIHENTSELGVCITCDCCRAFILANRSNIVKKSIEKILSIQLNDSSEKTGWGYTITDKTSRITATCWVVDMLFYAVKDPTLVCEEIKQAIKSAVNWLITAVSTDGEKKGWGESRGSSPKVSCTAWALYIILEAAKLQYIEIDTSNHKRIILDAINTIKKLYSPEYTGWVGSPEGYKTLKMKGLGSSIVLIALIEAANAGFIDVDDIYISYALEETQSEKNGWITPSYKETQVYENVYWILALSKLERLYLKHSKNIKNKYEKLAAKYERLLKWNLRILAWGIIIAIGIVMYNVITFYSNNLLIPILQSLIASFIWEYPLRYITNKISARSKVVNE